VAFSLRRGLLPLERLCRQAEGIDATSMNVRFPTEGLPAELTPISRRLNDLLARLEKSFERERQFSADIAHELRTPIGELRALSEVAIQLPNPDSAAHQDTLAIALQMERIVNRLLDIARCEQERLPLRLEPVALVKLVADTWTTFAASAEQRGLTLRFQPGTEQPVLTDEVLLRTIVANLLANAVAYAPPGDEVTVELQSLGPRLSLAISNRAGQLTTEDLPHLFERFWRKDGARSSSLHSGLGLAVSEAFARHLGCRLTASLTNEQRLVIGLSGLVPVSGQAAPHP
jgi:two-component system sensor histidine kinase QseC